MAGFQQRLVQAGINVQAGKGSPAANPYYQFGVLGGKILNAEIAESDLDLTWPGRILEGHERTELKPVSDFETVAMPRLARLLLTSLMGADAVSYPAGVAYPGFFATLSADTLVGAVSMTMSATPPNAANVLRVGYGANAENIAYSAAGGGVVACSPLKFAHSAGEPVSILGITHTITPADDALYLTVFGRTASNYLQLADAKIDELELSFDRTQALRMKPKLVGCTEAFLGAPWAPAPPAGLIADERIVDGYLTASGTAFLVDGLSCQAVSGSVKFSNHLTPVMTAYQTTPTDVFIGMLSVEFALKVIPDDLNLWRKTVMGSVASNTPSPVPYYGALDFKWAADPFRDLRITAPRAKILSQYPDANPQGGPATVDVAASISTPGAPAAVVCVIHGNG